MSKYDKNSAAKLPLIEAVIIVAIFVVVSVLIMSVFVSADRMQREAVDISEASVKARCLAEEILAQSPTDRLDFGFETSRSQIAAEDADGKKFDFYFDDSWEETSFETREFTVSVEFSAVKKSRYNGGILEAKILVEDSDGEKYFVINTQIGYKNN